MHMTGAQHLRRLAKAALYNGESCARFVASAEELQAVLLSSTSAHLRPGVLLEYEALLQEANSVFACFSSRWSACSAATGRRYETRCRKLILWN